MKRCFVGAILAATAFAAHAYLGPHSIMEDARRNSFRKGWPLHFNVTLGDWGLRGPVKCVVAYQVKNKGIREKHCFDREGRITNSQFQEYIEKDVRYEYEGDKLRRMITRYESGEVATERFEYSSRGYLVRAISVSSTDPEKQRHFRAKKFPDESKPSRDDAEQPASQESRREIEFEYDENGYISRTNCVFPPADSSCMMSEQQSLLDGRGRPQKIITPRMLDLYAPLDFSARAQGRPPPTARAESEFQYNDQLKSVIHTSYRNGRVLATTTEFANAHGDVVTRVREDSFGNSDISYRYTYDSQQNWTHREGVGDDRTSQVPIVRELAYWNE